MQDLTTQQDVDQLFGGDTAIVFKHSTECPISANARREMESFESAGGSVPIYRVDVNEQQELSESIAERTGLEHQSPQVIVLRHGRPEWNASGFEITAGAVRGALGLANPAA